MSFSVRRADDDFHPLSQVLRGVVVVVDDSKFPPASVREREFPLLRPELQSFHSPGIGVLLCSNEGPEPAAARARVPKAAAATVECCENSVTGARRGMRRSLLYTPKAICFRTSRPDACGPFALKMVPAVTSWRAKRGTENPRMLETKSSPATAAAAVPA